MLDTKLALILAAGNGLRLMAQNGTFKAFDIMDARWEDVDTPAALDYAQQTFPFPEQNILAIPRAA